MLGVMTIISNIRQCGSRGEKGVSEVLEIVSEVCRKGEYQYRQRGVIMIR